VVIVFSACLGWQKNNEALLEFNMKVSLKMNEKKHMLCHHQNAGQNLKFHDS
jgi:hypothetical protein